MRVHSLLSHYQSSGLQLVKIERIDQRLNFTPILLPFESNHTDLVKELSLLISNGMLALHSKDENRLYLNKKTLTQALPLSSSISKANILSSTILNLSNSNDEVEFCEMNAEQSKNLKLLIQELEKESGLDANSGKHKPADEQNTHTKKLSLTIKTPLIEHFKNDISFKLHIKLSKAFSTRMVDLAKDEKVNQEKRKKLKEENQELEKYQFLKNKIQKYFLKAEEIKKYLIK
ncbi:hypothetical protein PHSC3_002061 [Chlamydiales bacterium STE3]|nr:hypothetical protein PHSC3_002061 [Chlamydiales bacterium STE3]